MLLMSTASSAAGEGRSSSACNVAYGSDFREPAIVASVSCFSFTIIWSSMRGNADGDAAGRMHRWQCYYREGSQHARNLSLPVVSAARTLVIAVRSIGKQLEHAHDVLERGAA